MNKTKLIFKLGQAGFLLGSMLLVTSAGGAGSMDGPRVGVQVDSPAFVAQDDYVYYPSYGVYYSSSRHQYASQEGGAWVGRPAPSGVSVDVLLRSPSVRMDFHDSPANHHAAMVQKYPKNWKPAGPDHDQKANRPDEHSDRNQR